MAITVDVQPAFAAASAAAVTTASFTPTAGSLLVACVGIANGNNIAGAGSTVITDTGSHTWTLLKRQQNTGFATAEVWVADNASTSAITVTATSQISTQVDVCIQAISYNGAAAAASQTGATVGANDNGTATIVTTVTGSQVVGGYGFSTTVATLAAFNSATTIFGQNNGGAGDTNAAFKATNLTGTPGSTQLGCLEGTLSSQAIAFAEIVPGSPVVLSAFPGIWPGGFAPGINGGKIEQLFSFQLLGDRNASTIAAQTITCAGVPSPQRAGAATVAAGTVTVAPAGVPSPARPGAATVLATNTLNPAGTPSPQRTGAATAVNANPINPAGIRSPIQTGAATVAATASVNPAGIPISGRTGAATVAATASVTVAGVPSPARPGALTATLGGATVAPAGTPGRAGVGAATVTPGAAPVNPAGTVSRTGVGAATVSAGAVTVAPAGVPSPARTGALTTSTAKAINPAGVSSPQRTGAATVAATATVQPAGVPTSSKTGAAGAVGGAVTVRPAGTPSAARPGAAGAVAGNVVQTVSLSGISTRVGIGMIHVCLVRVIRPASGTTVNVTSDITTRPNAGITEDKC